LSVAENALLEERLDAAATAIDAARKAGVDNGHLAFLSAQLAKSLGRSKAAGAQNRARPDSRASGSSLPALPPSTGEERLTQLLRLAAERIQRGQLIDPPHDNARLYIEEALRIDPHTNAAQAAKQSLALALLTEAHAALDRHDFTHAAAVLDAADGIAAPSNLESLRQQLTGARAQAAADASEQLFKSGLERLQQDRLLEPPNDNAKYYLAALQATNPSYPGLAAARQDLGARLVAKARRAQTLQQPEAARAWLDEAAALGFASPDATAVLHDLETARPAAGAPAPSREVVPAGQLTLIKRVAPTYPRRAELDRIEGWVELDFTVTTDGAVKDVTIHGAEPAGVFNAAAIKALTQWRYQPVLRDATPISQRARIRIRFTLAG
jgi:TonB family protein